MIFFLILWAVTLNAVRCNDTFPKKAPHVIKIITPRYDHSFELNITELKSHLDKAVELKDRDIVVVSMTGVAKIGKSFLFNFYLNFLNSKYNKFDILEGRSYGKSTVDWTKQNVSSTNGFPWKKKSALMTKGVEMWSEIFTHDYDNGTKIAIILWDTQGLSHSETDTHQSGLVSAITTVLSSVQCFNLDGRFDRLYELHYFELFYQYAQIALIENETEKPFQRLTFIVRDYRYPDEMRLGWNELKNFESNDNNNNKTKEFQLMLNRLRATFGDIQVFLMPSPGEIVVDYQNYTGDVNLIQHRFRDGMNSLIPGLLNPENLVIKKINGNSQKVRDLVDSIKTLFEYLDKNKDLLPGTLLDAMVELNNLKLTKDSLYFYIDTMKKAINQSLQFFEPNEFLKLHEDTKNKSIVQYLAKPKLGGYNSTFQENLEIDIEKEYLEFSKQNGDRRKSFIDITISDFKLKKIEIERKSLKKMDDLFFNGTNGMTVNDANIELEKIQKDGLSEFKNSTTKKIIYQSTKEINDTTNELHKELEAILQAYSSDLLRANNDELKQNEFLKGAILPGAIGIVCAVIAGIILFKFIRSRRLKKEEEIDNEENDNKKNNDKSKMSIDTKMSA